MKYRKKPVVVEAITFDELVSHARNQLGCEGIPASFDYAGKWVNYDPVSHVFLIPTLEGMMKMGTQDMLITGVAGEIYPCKRDIFEATYEPAE